MNKHLDALAHQVKRYGLVLAYSPGGYATLAFTYPALPAGLRQEIRNHRRGLARLMDEGRIEVCPARDLHRRSWFYREGKYYCGLCLQLRKAAA